MAEHSTIEWTSATWTPVRARRFVGDTEKGWPQRIGWHCEHASPGCVNCYAEGINRRLGTGMDFKPVNLVHRTPLGDPRGEVTMFLDDSMLLAPLKWRRPREIFVCSMTDLFASFVKEDWIASLFAVMALAPRHTFQVLTKRADRMAEFLLAVQMGHRIRGRAWSLLGQLPKYRHEGVLGRPWPLPNVVIGVSVENQRFADERRDALAKIAAAGWRTWVSYEPALGPIDWSGWEFVRCIVSGGESGIGARPSHPDWHRATRDFCAARGIAYCFKQWGEWAEHDAGPPPHALLSMDTETGRATASACDGFISLAGEFVHDMDDATTDEPYRGMQRIGKKAAGRLLDGVEHNGFPA